MCLCKDAELIIFFEAGGPAKVRRLFRWTRPANGAAHGLRGSPAC
jgi:hypothetical protein